MLYHISLY